ncbi:MAG: aldo/keto reductase [Ignavibacteriaceae bacterium]|nr:aldo/keto reductase [Ignavibacteriaceae bacterium]
MLQRQLGKTNINVSVLGFGAGHIGGNNLTESEASNLLNSIVDLGINLFDTARGYGLSEERIGYHLSYRRNEIVISTKVGYGVAGVADWTYECVERGINEALIKLRTDYIDIVHLHSCPLEILQSGEVISALIKARGEGKIRAAAYSGENEALEFALTKEIDSLQCSINLFDQKNIGKILPAAVNQKIGIIAKRPLANVPWRFKEQPFGEYCEEYWKRMKKMNLQLGIDWLEAAIRFSAFTEGVNSIIIGTTSIDHLKMNLQLFEKGKLPDEIYSVIRNAFEENTINWNGQI